MSAARAWAIAFWLWMVAAPADACSPMKMDWSAEIERADAILLGPIARDGRTKPWSRTVFVQPERAIRNEVSTEVAVAAPCGVDSPGIGEQVVVLHKVGKRAAWLLVPEWIATEHGWLPPRADEQAR